MRITVANLKGGVGKTVTAVHLAAGLATQGRTPLLVDADPQGSAQSWADAVGEAFPCATVPLPADDLDRQLRALEVGHTDVVIDTPPEVVEITRAAIRAADVVVMPLRPSTMDVDRLRPTIDLVAEVERETGRPVTLAVLITQARAGTRMARELRPALEALGVPVLAGQVPLREAYAISHGAPPAPHVDYAPVLAELQALPLP